jgi:hypothetical protein
MKHSKLKKAAAFALSLIAFAAIQIAATPSAEAASWGCPIKTRTVCLFFDINGDGEVGYYTEPQTSYYIGDHWNDQISSIDSWSSYTAGIYEHSYFKGRYASVVPNARIADLRSYYKSWNWNDQISSFNMGNSGCDGGSSTGITYCPAGATTCACVPMG